MGSGVTCSFVLGNPEAVAYGVKALIKNQRGIGGVFSTTLYSNSALPAGIAGEYTVTVGLVPKNKSPTVAHAIP